MAKDEEGVLPDPFILRDKGMHSRMKRNGNSAYAMSSIVKMEEFADRETVKLFQAWDELYAASGQPFDVGRWMIFYALDAIFALTYGEDFGFLDKRSDQYWFIDTLEKISDYGAVVRALLLFQPLGGPLLT
jgi:cytochrome P450